MYDISTDLGRQVEEWADISHSPPPPPPEKRKSSPFLPISPNLGSGGRPTLLPQVYGAPKTMPLFVGLVWIYIFKTI